MGLYALWKAHRTPLPFWRVPILYAGVTIVLGFTFPHLEYRYLADYNPGVPVAIATAFFASIASGMLALTAIVFSLAFVMVQFSSTAYSPRLVVWLSRDPILWHALGLFTATFLYALVALLWVDRGGLATCLFSRAGASWCYSLPASWSLVTWCSAWRCSRWRG